MKLFADFRSEKNKNYDHIELCYSSLMWISGNNEWFCRIWRKDWINFSIYNGTAFGEAYGRNKFEAYRLALKNLQS